jgi:AAA15 family ATPase/GTPase
MIAEFTIENYRSFKEKQTFSLLATKNKELLASNTFEIDNKQRLLKSAVIYGANASGKSNFFKALVFFLNFAVWSGPRKQTGDIIDVDYFYFSKQTEQGPASFELIFYLKNTDGKNVRYRYGFTITREEVIAEYLFAIYNTREITLFTREKQAIITTSHFHEGSKIKSTVRSNCSVLSICAQHNGDISKSIIQYFIKMTITSGLNNINTATKRRLSKPDDNAYLQVLNFLHYADIQVKELTSKRESVDINELPPEIADYFKRKHGAKPQEKITYFFAHDYFDGKEKTDIALIPEYRESKGTQKLFAYSIPIFTALENGTPLFIDEFDTQLHPLILENIIRLFHSPDINKNNAQLIISCHAVNIMTNKNFRRDQIWFCEKDQYGATDLYSLVEYDEPIRNDAAFGKNYLQGKYGAVPYINEIALQFGKKNNGA